jgi:hypothetical protein
MIVYQQATTGKLHRRKSCSITSRTRYDHFAMEVDLTDSGSDAYKFAHCHKCWDGFVPTSNTNGGDMNEITTPESKRAPQVHRFPGLTSGEVYDRTQTDDTIKDGDVLVVPPNEVEQHDGIVGILVEAWPVVIHGGDVDGIDNQFHRLDHIGDFLDHEPKYVDSVELARETSARESS